MTDELPADPATPGRGGLGTPGLRASHADRDRVVDTLRVAAGDGRLTADELDERLEAALSARTHGDLAALTADLPASGTEQPKDVVRITQRFGDAARTGRWVVPKRMEIRSTAGNVKLDFTEAVITHDALSIDVELGFGSDLLLVTRPGVVVDADDLEVSLGEVKLKAGRNPDAPVVLRVKLAGRVRGADVVARPQRRTFWQWLRRRPLQYPALTG
jgi:hypothetical protein